MMRARKVDLLLLALAIIALVAIAVQYPLSTSFPIGGDAAAHITVVRNPTLVTQTWYPGAYALFSTLHLVPLVDWPTKFVWWMALGQIVTGGAIGLLAYRLGGTLAAAGAIGIWAATPMEMTPFFEDATMPQLWSLPWLLLLYERYISRSFVGMLIALALCLTTHPLTAVIVTMSAVLALLLMTGARLSAEFLLPVMNRHSLYVLLGVMFIIIVTSGVFLTFKTLSNDKLNIAFTPSSSKYIREFLGGSFTPWLMATIGGLAVFGVRKTVRIDNVIVILSFVFIATLFAFNNFLGIGFWSGRTVPYFVVTAALFGGLFLGHTVPRVLRHSVTQFSFIAAIFLLITFGTWRINAHIYNRYESPSLYTRIHQQELEAIYWMRDNLEPGSRVFTSSDTRHYEWIAALTPFQWKAIQPEHLSRYISTLQEPAYTVFFLRQEQPPAEIVSNPRFYEPMYRNGGAVVFRNIAAYEL